MSMNVVAVVSVVNYKLIDKKYPEEDNTTDRGRMGGRLKRVDVLVIQISHSLTIDITDTEL